MSETSVEVSVENGKVTMTCDESTWENLANYFRGIEREEGPQPEMIGKIWWCVTCSSGLRKSVKAYTEIDAGFGVCWLQPFSVRRGKCD